jgi:hypothetical protein
VASGPDPGGAAGAWWLLERLRWGDGRPACPRCGGGPAYPITPRDGVRRTRAGGRSARRLWVCGTCRRQFSVLTGTVLEGTRVDLRVWLAELGVPETGAAVSPSALRRVRRTVRAARAVAVEAAVDDLTLDPGSSRSGLGLARGVLRLGTAEVAAVRAAVPPARRSPPSTGPSADWGDG